MLHALCISTRLAAALHALFEEAEADVQFGVFRVMFAPAASTLPTAAAAAAAAGDGEGAEAPPAFVKQQELTEPDVSGRALVQVEIGEREMCYRTAFTALKPVFVETLYHPICANVGAAAG